MPRLISWKPIKKNRYYTAKEAGAVLGVTPCQINTWVRRGLTALVEQKPCLILGADIIAYLKNRIAKKYKRCALDQFYCFSCRTPRVPVEQKADIVRAGANGLVHLKGFCPACSTTLSILRSAKQIEAIKALLMVTYNVVKVD